MSRTLAGLRFLLVAAAIPCACLQAEEPAKQGGTIRGQALQVLSGANVYTGETAITGGTLELRPGTIADTAPAPPTPAACQPGKAFYIITEGAGLGDNVRRVPCTGKETVMDAISAINGLSQLSSTKMWVARPSPNNRDKSTILAVDWEAVAKRGINATNYTLQPGDRLVIGQDPEMTRNNLVNKKIGPVERCMGFLSLTCSTLNSWDSISPAQKETMKELLRKGVLTDDEGLTGILGELIRQHDLERAKAGSKEAEKSKPSQ